MLTTIMKSSKITALKPAPKQQTPKRPRMDSRNTSPILPI